MDPKTSQNRKKNRFMLSLKKNRNLEHDGIRELNRSSDVIVLEESFDSFRKECPTKMSMSSCKIYSPIVINDSSELSDYDDFPKITIRRRRPSKSGKESFNSSKDISFITEDVMESAPSVGGWSPAQNIITATPKNNNAPSTPKDIANESLEECSIKKIQQSQKKVLDELYGGTWKSIPKLFKTIKQNYKNYDNVTKKLQFNDDNESDKENIKHHLQENRKLYLTGSDAKHKVNTASDSEKKCKKKLYTEKVPSTPEPTKVKVIRNVNTTTKKLKGKSVTEMVEIMVRNDVDVSKEKVRDSDVLAEKVRDVGVLAEKVRDVGVLAEKVRDVAVLAEKVRDVSVTPVPSFEVKRLSFIGSLADNVPSWRCHVEAIQYHDHYKTLREKLTRRLYEEFNKVVFDNALDADLPIIWDGKLRTTAGTTTNRLIKNSRGDRIRTSSVKLSTKVLNTPQRLRDTLIHELCHAATWLVDKELRAGHGPLWKKWASRALRLLPELGEISRCHSMEIHHKYTYKCTKCGYSIQRHSKSVDVTKKCCGYCRGTFTIIVNKINKDGVVVSTPARKGGVNGFAQYVKDNYGIVKNGKMTHAQVMKILSEQFSAVKGKPEIDNKL